MQIGCCTNIENYNALVACGYDAITLAGKDITALRNDEFSQMASIIQNGSLSFSSVNASFPANIKLNGADYDAVALEAYTRLLCIRVKELGGRYIGIGSPKSRSVLDGFSREKAMDQFEEAVRMMCSVASEYGITFCIEACCTLETNFITTTMEAYSFLKKLNVDIIELLPERY